MTTGRADDSAPAVGRVARDTAKQRLGMVLAIDGDRVRLEGLSNGQVWVAALAKVRRVSAREELSLRTAAANARSRNYGRL